jgi:hypothetical protein
MEQRVSYIFIFYKGTSKKVLQFFVQMEPIYNKNFCFNEQKSFLWALPKGLNNKKSLKWHYIYFKIMLY